MERVTIKFLSVVLALVGIILFSACTMNTTSSAMQSNPYTVQNSNIVCEDFVSNGEILGEIATRYGMSPSAVISLNDTLRGKVAHVNGYPDPNTIIPAGTTLRICRDLGTVNNPPVVQQQTNSGTFTQPTAVPSFSGDMAGMVCPYGYTEKIVVIQPTDSVQSLADQYRISYQEVVNKVPGGILVPGTTIIFCAP